MKISRNTRTFLISGIAATVAFGGSYLLTPRYHTMESLYFPMAQSDTGPLAALKGGGQSDQGAMVSLGGALSSPLVGSAPQTAMGILQSRTLIQEVCQRLKLAEHWRTTEVEAERTLKGRLIVKVDTNGFLSTEVEDESPEMAADILKTAREILVARSSDLSVDASKHNREYVESQVDLARKEVEVNQERLAQTLRQGPLLEPEAFVKSYMETKGKIAETKIQLDNASATMDVVRHQMDQQYTDTKKPLSRVLGLEALKAGGDDYAKRYFSLEEAKTIYTDQAPEVQEAQRSMDFYNQFTDKLLAENRRTIEAGYNPKVAGAEVAKVGAETNIKSYTALADSLAKQGTESAIRSTQVMLIRRDFDSALVRLSMLQGELEKAKIAESREPSRFEVVDSAVPTDERVFPKRTMMAGLAFFIALMIQILPGLFRATPDHAVVEMTVKEESAKDAIAA